MVNDFSFDLQMAAREFGVIDMNAWVSKRQTIDGDDVKLLSSN